MKTLSITEAREYFEKYCPKYYLFATVNQDDAIYPRTMYISSKYSKMLTSDNTNEISFKNNQSTLCFSGVKYVRIKKLLSTEVFFYIVCFDETSKTGETVYEFIAPKRL